MMRKAELIAGFVVAGLAAAVAAPVWDARDGVVFAPDKAPSIVLHQCSRPSPGNIESYWMPEAGQIEDLERRLPEYLEQALRAAVPAKGHRTPVMPNYLRQYAGIVVNGKKLIYVNGIPADLTYPGDGKARQTDWRDRPQEVCDGFINYFGVTYDPAAQEFSGLAFNGAA